MVVAHAKAQYGCKELFYMEVEDVGGDGTAGSHWKRRSAKDELMAGISGAGIYSAITIAAMEDLGFYKGNYAMAEPMAYGKNVGCGLMTDKCVVKGVSQFPEMFCGSADATKLVCASDRLGVGICRLVNYPASLPPQFQYFSTNTLGGDDDKMDYCPFVHAFIETNCTYDGRALNGSVYGTMSRCLDAPAGFAESGRSGAQYGICAEVHCCSTSTYSVKLRGAKTLTTCTPGTTLTLSSLSSKFSDGHITCPPYDSVCSMRGDLAQYDPFASSLHDVNAAGAWAGMAAALAVAAAALVVSTT